MKKAIKIRIYPDVVQQNYLARQFGCCRQLFNNDLDYRTQFYKENGIFPDFKLIQENNLNFKHSKDYMSDVNAKVLQQSIRNLDQAFQNFFKHGAEYPKFKKKEERQTARFPKDAISSIRGNRLSLVKQFKDVLFSCSRKDESYINKHFKDIINITVIKEKDGRYFASICIDYEPEKVKQTNNVIGIDLGLKTFATCSDGTKIDSKFDFSREAKHIKKLQKQFSRQTKNNVKKGKNGNKIDSRNLNDVEQQDERKGKRSKNAEKTRKKIAKIFAKIKDKKTNFYNELISKLIDENQIICLETLNIEGMMQNHHLAAAIQAQGWSEFITKLKQKAEQNGRIVVQVGRFYPSSKTCSECGYKKTDLTLDVREWTCPICGKKHDRDVNAAINIKNEGLRLLNEPTQEKVKKSKKNKNSQKASNC